MASRASEKQPGKYRADVDGMRALAVVLVVLNHVGLGFAGGYVGVDVFFVISGYLITGIVWRELLAGSFSFGGFYERRARRILPAFGVTALVTLAAGWYLLLPYEYKLLGRSVVAASLGFSNITFWGESGYFDMAAAEKPFLHTWSLGVEEQFYLVLPGLMFVLFRLGLGRWLPGVFVGLFAASLGLSVW
jgi:peptidoglycan/LPS O-acetylase OafA/YrhL